MPERRGWKGVPFLLCRRSVGLFVTNNLFADECGNVPAIAECSLFRVGFLSARKKTVSATREV